MKKLLLPILSCFLILSVIAIFEYNNGTDQAIPDANITTPLPTPTDIIDLTTQDTTDTDTSAKTIATTNTAYTKEINSSTITSILVAPSKDTLSKLVSGSIVDVSKNKKDIIKIAFYYEKINKDIKVRIKGKSYKKDCTVPYENLRYVRVLYYGFDKKTHIGELIVNKQIAKDITAIFKELYLAKYPIEKMVLIDDYEADDEASMADNNTTSFNYRIMTGSKNLSKHALGLAIDINPLYNPYVKATGSKIIVSPDNGYEYRNRNLDNPYYYML
ncbi:MAG: putative secreted protein [Anaerocolumna sp.]|nr:putative secreted protein [Anaerocolumna sp.]